MATVTMRVDVTGAKRKLAAFRQRAVAVADQALSEEAGLDARDFQAIPYPPPPEQTRYRRTFRLKRSYRKYRGARTGTSVEWGIVNTATSQRGTHYASYVIGDDDNPQASHMAYWWKAVDEYKKRAPRKAARIRRQLIQLWKGL